jgi:hypothetical protein
MVGMTHATSAALNDHVFMTDTPPPVRRWWLSYWAIAAALFVGGELFMVVLLLIAGQCHGGDCEGGGIAALFLVALMYAWAVIWLIAASVLRLAWTIGAVLLGVRKPATPVEHMIVLRRRD